MTTAEQPQPDPNDFDGSEEFSGRDGRIITFYSYKGGTGRSMALANAAFVLGMHGKRVLVIDWDLEAPGLHRYFHPFLEDPQLDDSDGLLEFVGRLAATAAREPVNTVWADKPNSYFAQYADILSFSQPVRFPDFPPGGALDFIPAGRQDRTYSERLSLFRFIDFYEKLGGRRFLEAAKQTVRDDYDYILIDSRTGVSDTSGICTVQMPDTLVLCFTLNEQNIVGAAEIARRVRAQRETEKRDTDFRIFPVPCRVELSEHDRRMVSLDRVKRLFNTYLVDLKFTEKEDYWGRAQIVYIPYYAFEEIPALFGNPPGESISMLTSAVQMVSLVCGLKGEPASLLDDRRKEFLRSFLYSPDDPLTLARGILEEFPQQDAVKSLLLRFVAPGSGTLPDSTRPVALGDVKPDEWEIMERFRDAGLLVQDDSASPPVLRLVREDIIRSWGVLSGWIAGEREFFEWRSSVESALAAWRDRKKNPSFLLRDSQLIDAREWRDRRSADLPEEILEYISLSEESDPLRAGERICQTAGVSTARHYFLRFVDAHGSPRFVGESEITPEDRIVHILALTAHLIRPVESGPVSKITGESGYQLTDDGLPWNWTEYRRWIDLDQGFLAARDEISSLARTWINQHRDPALLTRGRQLDALLQSLAGRKNELPSAAADFLNACDQNDPVRRAQKGYVEAGAEATARVLLRFVRTPRNSSMPSVVTYPRMGFSQEDLEGPVALFQRLGIIAESDPLALTEPSLITEWSWLAGRIGSDRAALEQITGLEDLASGWEADGRPNSLLLPADQLEKRASATLMPRLSPVAREFVAGSMVQHRARQRFRRIVVATVAAVLAVAVFLGFYFFRQPKSVDLLQMAAAETSADLRSLLIAEWLQRQSAAGSFAVSAQFSAALGAIPLPIFIPATNAPSDLKQVQFDSASHLIAAGSSSCTVYQPNGAKLRQAPVASAVIALAPTGTLAITNPGGGVSVLGSDGTPLTGNVDTIQVSAMAFAGSNTLVKGDSGGLSTWELPQFKRSSVFFTPLPRMIRCDDKGIRCGVVSDDSSARLWDVDPPHRTLVLTHNKRVLSLDFAPASSLSMVVTASEDNTARIWTLTAARPSFDTLQHDGPVRDAHFFGLSQVITASDDKTAKIWDVQTGALKTTLAMEDPVLTANFSPNGQTVATASGRWLRLWSIGAKPKKILEYGFQGSVLGLNFSADGHYLAAAGTGGEIQVWNLPTFNAAAQFVNAPALSSQLCSQAQRNLTPAEWLKLFPKEPYRRTCGGLPIPDNK